VNITLVIRRTTSSNPRLSDEANRWREGEVVNIYAYNARTFAPPAVGSAHYSVVVTGLPDVGIEALRRRLAKPHEYIPAITPDGPVHHVARRTFAADFSSLSRDLLDQLKRDRYLVMTAAEMKDLFWRRKQSDRSMERKVRDEDMTADAD